MASIAGDDRGQMHTLEGIGAAFLIIMVLAIVVQTTSVTPLSTSFTNQHVKLELQNMGSDILSTMDATPVSNATGPETPSLLKQSIVDWAVYYNYDLFSWNNTTYFSMTNTSHSDLNTPLSNILKFALIDNGILFDVEVSYVGVDNNVRTSKMIWNGDPSENSVTVSRFVVLQDDNYEIPPGTRFDEGYILPDVSGPGESLHNVAEVRLTMWVM